jgi:hypothetical protein
MNAWMTRACSQLVVATHRCLSLEYGMSAAAIARNWGDKVCASAYDGRIPVAVTHSAAAALRRARQNNRCACLSADVNNVKSMWHNPYSVASANYLCKTVCAVTCSDSPSLYTQLCLVLPPLLRAADDHVHGWVGRWQQRGQLQRGRHESLCRRTAGGVRVGGGAGGQRQQARG